MYQWLVFAHLVGLVFFACAMACRSSARSGSAACATRRRSGASSLTTQSSRLMYIGLILLAVGGIGAASSANLWGATWITWSIVVFIAVIVAMYAVARATTTRCGTW